MNESGTAVRGAGHALRDRRPGDHRDRARRARPAAGHRAPEGGGRPGRPQRAALGPVASALRRTSSACASGSASPRARRRARRTSCAGRPRRCARSSPHPCRTAADAVERIAADGIDAAMRGATRCPTSDRAEMTTVPTHTAPSRSAGRRWPRVPRLSTRRTPSWPPSSARPTPPSPSLKRPRRWSSPHWRPSPSAPRWSWSPPRGSMPSASATTSPASSPRPGPTRPVSSGRSAGRWRCSRRGRRCPSSASARRSRRWGGAWPSSMR